MYYEDDCRTTDSTINMSVTILHSLPYLHKRTVKKGVELKPLLLSHSYGRGNLTYHSHLLIITSLHLSREYSCFTKTLTIKTVTEDCHGEAVSAFAPVFVRDRPVGGRQF